MVRGMARRSARVHDVDGFSFSPSLGGNGLRASVVVYCAAGVGVGFR